MYWINKCYSELIMRFPVKCQKYAEQSDSGDKPQSNVIFHIRTLDDEKKKNTKQTNNQLANRSMAFWILFSS